MTPVLRHRIVLQRPDHVADAGGGRQRAWVEFARVWAQARALSATADDGGDRSARARRIEIVMRHRDDVTFETRLIHRGRTYELRDIRSDGERLRWLILECEEALA